MINWITKENASTIHPEQAKKWIDETNVGNRNMRITHIDYLVRQILIGNFILTGATIAFDAMGRLIDGQHRLMACIKAGMAIEAFVVRGLSEKAYEATDQNLIRTIQDVTQFSQRQVGILNAYMNIIQGNGARKKRSPLEYMQLYTDKQVHFDSIFSLYSEGKKIGLASVWAALVLFSESDYEKAREFAIEYKLPFTSVTQVQVFKNWLLNTDNSSGGFQTIVTRKSLYAMDAYYRGKTISKALEIKLENAFT